ncbi:hypothetical protein LG3211_0916 [Lysobacter gummosus]|nr:hypothetical protein LG3211_0916 [Lysobacter gummosus]
MALAVPKAGRAAWARPGAGAGPGTRRPPSLLRCQCGHHQPAPRQRRMRPRSRSGPRPQAPSDRCSNADSTLPTTRETP